MANDSRGPRALSLRLLSETYQCHFLRAGKGGMHQGPAIHTYLGLFRIIKGLGRGELPYVGLAREGITTGLRAMAARP